MRASTNISTKNIKQMRVEEFRGVDFSSSPLRAASYRATSAKNWIRRDGANQKRNGWRQKIIDENLTNPIKGMYQYKKGQYTFLLVLTANGESGKARIYVKSSGEWIYNNTEYTFNTVSGIQQIQAFQKNGKFFILTGINIYVYDYSATTPSVYALVNNNNITAYEAYQADQNRTGAKIPTTTISIDPVGTIDTNRETLDAVNILTPFRKNTLLGSGSSNQEYRLDGYFDAYSNYSDEKMLIKISERQQNIEHGMYEEVVNYYIFKYGHTDDTN